MSGSWSREAEIERLVASERLWPIVDYHSCRICAAPRRPEHARDFPVCYACAGLRTQYGDALADLFPITYTTRDWPLGAALRQLKDEPRAPSNEQVLVHIGAVLSAFLEHQLGRLGMPLGFGAITTAPSSVPVIASALNKAAACGWWAPPLVEVASARPGLPRQRERPGPERAGVENKWEVDEAAVLGRARARAR